MQTSPGPSPQPHGYAASATWSCSLAAGIHAIGTMPQQAVRGGLNGVDEQMRNSRRKGGRRPVTRLVVIRVRCSLQP